MGCGASRVRPEPAPRAENVSTEKWLAELRVKVAALEAENCQLKQEIRTTQTALEESEKIRDEFAKRNSEQAHLISSLTTQLNENKVAFVNEQGRGKDAHGNKFGKTRSRPSLQPLPPARQEDATGQQHAQKAKSPPSTRPLLTHSAKKEEQHPSAGTDGHNALVASEVDASALLTLDQLRESLGNQVKLSEQELTELFKELAGGNGRVTRAAFMAGVRARPSAEATSGIVSLLRSSKVLEKLAEGMVLRIKDRIGWCVPTELGLATILERAEAEDVRRAWEEVEAEVVSAMATALGAMHARETAAKTARAINDKFASDNSTLKEAVYKDLGEFRAGVEGSLGLPGKDILEGIRLEFCFSEDSRDEFVTSNYGGTRTTPEREFEFVVGAEAGRDYGGGRTAVPLQAFLYAVVARRANGEEDDVYGDDLEDLDQAMQDVVKGVLLRRVKEAGLTAHCVAEAAESDPRLERAARMGKRELLKLQQEVSKVLGVLGKEGGARMMSFDAMVGGLEDGGVLKREEADAMVEWMRERMRAARLWEEEVLALRLYTGPGYAKLNGALRGKRDGRKDNNYVCTIFAAISGMVKLAELTPIPDSRVVYRGQRGIQLPDCFWKGNAAGVRGGVELAFLSTTTDIQVALDYAAGGEIPTVLALEVGAVDRGAAVSFLSQYPNEEEILMPPRAFLEVVGEPGVLTTELGPVLSVPVKLNCNLLCPTLDKLRASRKTMLVSALEHMRKEVARDVNALMKTDAVRQRKRVDYFWRYRDERGGARFVESIKEEAARALAVAKARSAGWYNKDLYFRRAMQQAMEVQKKAMGKLALWLEERTLHVARMNSLSAEDCDRKAAARLRRLMEQAEQRAAAEGTEDAREERRRLAARLCRHMELIDDDVEEAVEETTGETALMLKAAEGAEEAVRLLLAARANVEAGRKDGMTALMLAARGGHTGVVRRLVLEGQADANRHDNLVLRQKKTDKRANRTQEDEESVEGFTALMYAAENGLVQTARVLMTECGADACIADESGRSAAHLAAHNGHLEMLKLLEREGGADLDAAKEGGTTPLMLAAQNGHQEVVAWLVEERNADFEARKFNGWTALMSAAANGETRVVAYLMKAKADVNVKREKGWTALLYASANGHVEVVRTLVKDGRADALAAHDAGWTPIISAASNGNVRVVQCLVREAGVDPNAAKADGGTALIGAASQGHEEVVRWLVSEGGADVNAAKHDGWTPLMGASAHGFVGVVSVLLEAGAYVEAAKVDGWRALMAAALNGHVGVVKMLVERGGADVNAARNNGFTVLMAAASNGHLNVVAWLMEQGRVDLFARRIGGHWDALMYAAANNHLSVVSHLIRSGGVDVDSRDSSGWTALMAAAGAGHKQVVAWLIQEGADVNSKNDKGQTAVVLAKKHTSVVSMLKAAGAVDVK